MARSDHWIGLNDEAERITEDAPSEPYARHQGAYYNESPLMQYFLPDGRTLQEVVQVDIWDGGPHWFTCLVDTATGERVAGSEWTDQQLADAVGFQVGEALPAITESERTFFADFSDAIASGQVTLSHADQQKYERWHRGVQPPPSTPALS